MIDIEKAKNEFMKYVSGYDITNPNIDRKIYHSLRVMEYCKNIAESLNFNKEEIDLAILIGLLHDIARFEQYTLHQTFSDYKSGFDHGNIAVEILEKDNFIRKFIKDGKYDEIIKVSIKNHNKFEIEEGLDDKAEVYCKIIRDADKLDIFYEAIEMFWSTDEETQDIETGIVSEEYLNYVIKENPILRDGKKRSKLDAVIFVITLIFNLNFKYSFKYLLENKIVEKILDRFEYKNEKGKNQVEEVKMIAVNYLKKNI